MGDREREITRLLGAARTGDGQAAEKLLPLVEEQLRRLAERAMRGDGAATLQPTVLVDDVFVRLVGDEAPSYESRTHFYAVAARAMHRILCDAARARVAARRGGNRQRITLSDVSNRPETALHSDLLSLNESLEQLRHLDPRDFEIVRLRFFGGLEFREIGEVLDLPESTVKDAWYGARAWLARELSRGEAAR